MGLTHTRSQYHTVKIQNCWLLEHQWVKSHFGIGQRISLGKFYDLFKVELGNSKIFNSVFLQLTVDFTSSLLLHKDSKLQFVSENSYQNGCWANSTFAAQTGVDRVKIQVLRAKEIDIKAPGKIKSMILYQNRLLLWLGLNISIQEFGEDALGKDPKIFPCETNLFSLNSDFLFTASGREINAFSTNNSAKTSYTIPQADGVIVDIKCATQSNSLFAVLQFKTDIKSWQTNLVDAADGS